MNQVILIGRVINVPEIKLENGHKTCVFNIEIERTRALPSEKSEAIDKKYYEFPRIFAFDEVAETFHKSIKKSDSVKVTGWIHIMLNSSNFRNYYHTEIIADEIELLEEEATYESL